MAKTNKNNQICRACNERVKKVTTHHIVPRKYLRYIPLHWIDMEDNEILICIKCHEYFESRIKRWYNQMEDSLRECEKYESLVRKGKDKIGAEYVRRAVQIKYENLVKRFNNDLKIFKFVIIARSKFSNMMGVTLKANVLNQTIINSCDEALKEFLNENVS